jgi:hypothetical protein
MKESDILNLGKSTSSSNQLPKHIVSPYLQDNTRANSLHLYPQICDWKVRENKPVINQEVSSLNLSLKSFCLLSDRKKEIEKVN